MKELTKIRNVMDRSIPGAPHDVMLVLDATGQNAFDGKTSVYQGHGSFLSSLNKNGWNG